MNALSCALFNAIFIQMAAPVKVINRMYNRFLNEILSNDNLVLL
jgi:hypothetical protein